MVWIVLYSTKKLLFSHHSLISRNSTGSFMELSVKSGRSPRPTLRHEETEVWKASGAGEKPVLYTHWAESRSLALKKKVRGGCTSSKCGAGDGISGARRPPDCLSPWTAGDPGSICLRWIVTGEDTWRLPLASTHMHLNTQVFLHTEWP